MSIVAFGRHIASSKPSDDELKFTFERDIKIKAHDEPYYKQGNPDFHTSKASTQRAGLFHNPAVQAELLKFWDVYEKCDDGRVAKQEYLRAHSASLLASSFDHDALLASSSRAHP